MKTGDVVEFMGVYMTVKEVKGDMVTCQWFAGPYLREGEFAIDTLKLANTSVH